MTRDSTQLVAAVTTVLVILISITVVTELVSDNHPDTIRGEWYLGERYFIDDGGGVEHDDYALSDVSECLNIITLSGEEFTGTFSGEESFGTFLHFFFHLSIRFFAITFRAIVIMWMLAMRTTENTIYTRYFSIFAIKLLISLAVVCKFNIGFLPIGFSIETIYDIMHSIIECLK